ncbi:MAG: cadmium-translocating P-type ATPase [Clostridiales bacterium]|nr:cadmium-translocating P-type ATPase [Clostridiales bacterium]
MAKEGKQKKSGQSFCEGHNNKKSCECGHNHYEEINKKEFALKIIFGGIFLIAGYIFNEFMQINEYIALAFFIVSYLIIGFGIIKDAVSGIVHGSIFNENFLICIASAGAFAIGDYSEGCMVVLLYTIGEFLQDTALAKSRETIKNITESKPRLVTVEKGGEKIKISPENIKAGEIFTVEPGEKIESDGIVVSGRAEVDTSSLTGEKIPLSVFEGTRVLSGSVNLDGAIKIKAEKTFSESTESKIMGMIKNADDKKSQTEKFISRFAKIYTPLVCLISVLIIVVPPLFFGGEWKEWIYRGLSALVVSCPCAIVISIPLGFYGGLGACSKQGILIKGGNYLELLSKFNIGAFDKSGIITSGKFEYVSCECIHCHCTDKSEHRELLGLIAACEKFSNHPVAKSVCLAFGHYADDLKVSDSENYPGMGVSAVINGKKYFAGNEKMMKYANVRFKETKLAGTAVYLCDENEFLGDIVFADVIRQDSKKAISEMYNIGVKKTVMFTSDKHNTAAHTAEKAGINDYYSGLLPAERADKIKELQEGGKNIVLYAGSGINDVPVLAQADLGAAVGGIKAAAAAEAADIVVMSGSLSKIITGRKIAKKTMRIVNENIIFSIGIKLLIIIGCAIGIFDENAMWLAVFGDVGVCLIAIANSLRALRYKEK